MSASSGTAERARGRLRLGELPRYVVAGVAYGSASLVEPYLLFNWLPALVFLLVIVWLLPALVGRIS